MDDLTGRLRCQTQPHTLLSYDVTQLMSVALLQAVVPNAYAHPGAGLSSMPGPTGASFGALLRREYQQPVSLRILAAPT